MRATGVLAVPRFDATGVIPRSIPTQFDQRVLDRICEWGPWLNGRWGDVLSELGIPAGDEYRYPLLAAHDLLLAEGDFSRRTLLSRLRPAERFRCLHTGRQGIVLRPSVIAVEGRVVDGVSVLALLGETVTAAGLVRGRGLWLLRPETVVLGEGETT